MCDVTEIIDEICAEPRPSRDRAVLLAAKLIVVGEKAALYRATNGVVQDDKGTHDADNVIAMRARG